MTNTHAIAFVAGRSGGHILPGLSLAQKFCTQHPENPILFFSTTHKLDMQIVGQTSLNVENIFFSLDNVPYKNPFKMLRFIYHFTYAYIKSLRVLHKKKVVKVVSMGGYISIPVCLAAWALRIPIELYELNVTPGKATRFLSRFANSISVCFDETKKYIKNVQCAKKEYPLLQTHQVRQNCESAKAALGLAPHKKVIFITGGSQGSVSINNHIKQWLSFNAHVHSLVQIIHQTGSQDTTDWAALYKSYDINAITFTYHNNLSQFYNAADVIVCRAGAGSLFEAVYFEKPCVVIPLETRATDHQKYNAQAIAQQYPSQFSVVLESHIKRNNTLFFSALNKHVLSNHPRVIETTSLSA
ncbi:UDP-N-acetylglucosamine--N-acetylmuramyl-(pentapeptide) pyrophosphoryl-undecaprenol N-acetylglucosamine transferase [Candidatus Dependentiae bacterium Noda2021]|nr:UDP-N-acetylglucosamine--N-acetylmuramyl-(pentapeptide) pyrophosphoryl-undecaprenol N-acetylglucosamine transferase [Candidatus Dependentiae bacterium Noda2021]